jgi:hypothetical protein
MIKVLRKLCPHTQAFPSKTGNAKTTSSTISADCNEHPPLVESLSVSTVSSACLLAESLVFAAPRDAWHPSNTLWIFLVWLAEFSL